MSMTKYMHPRNIYKTPPNFKQLAIDYPDFRQHVKQELSGKVSIDFKNLEALRSLTCTLLKKDFGLDVQIPLNKLIPTIPLRLNYILWIEDLMEISIPINETRDIKGVDIGTGASCVYPLIAASKNKWHMLATEIDDNSIEFARNNVVANQLEVLIEVQKVTKDAFFDHITNEYDFVMCNPPFFASHQEVIFEFKSRKHSRPRPKNAFVAAPQEIVAHGGEVEFISRMIKESQTIQTKIKVYTTMIGHASSLAPLKKLLRDVDVVSFKQTEFCQGNTTRWGLAWTFCDIDLRKVPETTLAVQRKQKKENTSFQYQITNVPETVTLNDVHIKLQDIFTELEFDFRVKQTKILYSYDIEAKKNTWQHQRRKRRAAQRAGNSSNDSNESKSPSMDDSGIEALGNQNSPMNAGVERTTELIEQMKVKSPKKRELDDDEGYYNNKRFKTGAESDENPIVRRNLLLSAKVSMFKDAYNINIELSWNDGHGNRDVLHQILQYLKNNLKL